MHSGSCIAPTTPAFSVSIGIAALVLEGRSVANDDEPRDATGSQQQLSSTASLWAKSDSVQNIHRLKQKLRQLRSAPSTSKDSAAEFTQATATMLPATEDFDSDNDLEPMMKSTTATSSSASSSGGSSGDTASLLDSLQNLASTCLKSKPRSLKAIGLFKTVDLDASFSTLLTRSSSTSSVMSKEMTKKCSSPIIVRKSSITCGFHCEQFLKKIGVIKQSQDNDAEHYCNDLAESCCRWQLQYKQMAAILSRGNGICIEVYLGPEMQPLLLEQWIIQKIDKPVEPAMTLQSLCTAIRSQLHFSQITAWTDLLSSGVEMRDNPRISFGQSLAPRLDIFYRVKSYDAVSNFDNPPLVHNFPNVRLDDGVAVQVCLKSLPRMDNIPKLNEEHAGAAGEEREMISVPCCMEKGKHRCTFDEESPTEIMSGMEILPSVVHREKQLQKYKKRLMRRDKKKMKHGADEEMLGKWLSGGGGTFGVQDEVEVATVEAPRVAREEMLRRSCAREFADGPGGDKMSKPPINDLRPPLYFASQGIGSCLDSRTTIPPPARSVTTQMTQGTQTATMVHDSITVSTQTDLMDCFPQCDLCNNEMQYICWNCDNNIIVNLAKDEMTTPCKAPLNKADMLLQAMQRTALAKSRSHDDHTCDRGSCDSGDLDCRLCKRQKIKHSYAPEGTDVRRELSQFDEMSLEVVPKIVKEFSVEDQYRTPPPQPSGATTAMPNVTTTPQRPPPQPDGFMATNGVINTVRSSLSRVRNLPKINLSSVFSDDRRASSHEHKSSPIPIRNIFNFDVVTPDRDESVVPVQKSNSAPTFNGSPQTLSPRFIKSAAIYKRRSRHLSDRSSERSSIGSDEQISDDDLTLESPMTSPLKLSSNSAWKLPFGRRGLLGSLEESLLQRRIVPKFQVPGFRILLGASGSFCPTQLTIPAKTFFYEISGETISTPYVCEVRLSRKGYSIPRSGTIQVTLLNPLGTVVRMFVVPYDFREMPNMATTFIRQRILAFDEDLNPGREVAQLTTLEQMKLLRYVIHLKFQTSRSGRLSLHSDTRMLISRRTDCDTAAAHAKDALESPNELKILTIQPDNPRFSIRIEKY